jgi:cell division septal protein FtsQ
MWFKRKPRNRRLGRDHVLDVKLRSSQVRAARLRLAGLACGILMGTVLGLYLLWRAGEWSLNRFVYQNKSFAIHDLDIQTDGVITIDQLRRWAGVKPEDNLMALDLGRVKRDLELVPCIQSASVERILPHTLRIRITEREPIAQVNALRPRSSGGIEWNLFHIDFDGHVMLPLTAAERGPSAATSFELPQIAGINPNDLQPGRRLEATQLKAALQLITAFEESSMAEVVEVKKIDISAADVIVVTTSQGAEVTFAPSDPEQQLRRWREIFDLGQKMGRALASLDLAVSNNIPARWLEASAVPPIIPKPHKTPKKKHV